MEYHPNPPVPVNRAVMMQSWNQLTFIHWPYDPEIVRAVLPPGLEPDVFEGQTWVGLVPFKMNHIRVPYGPPLPWLSSFPETNIRLYVRGPDGRDGVYFRSLDITRLVPTVVARTTYRLPYMWSTMEITAGENRIEYGGRRRWPGPRGAGARAEVVIGPPIPPEKLTRFDHYLTARWGLWTKLKRGLSYAPVEHPPWPLHRAELIRLDESLVEAAGLPRPIGDPVVHYSPGVTVRIGTPRVIAEH